MTGEYERTIRVNKYLRVPVYDEDGNRFCAKCLDYKPLSEFYAIPCRSKAGTPYIAYRCKIHSREKRRHSSRKMLYGMTEEQFTEMRVAQDNCCYICGEPQQRQGMELAVDHCHKTNKIRKLLCNRCNAGLALFQDNPDLLRKSARYIEDHQETT